MQVHVKMKLMLARINTKLLLVQVRIKIQMVMWGARVVQVRLKMRWRLHVMTPARAHQEHTISKGMVTTGACVQMKCLLVQAHRGWWWGVS